MQNVKIYQKRLIVVVLMVIAGVWGLVGSVCGAEVAADEPEVQVEPVVLNFSEQGRIRSVQIEDGSDVLTCTGGIFITQKQIWDGEEVFLELRADDAVIFYSQEALRQNESGAGDQKEPVGVYLEGDVVLQADRVDSVMDVKVSAKRLYFNFATNKAIILDATMRMSLAENAMPMYLRAEKIQQWSVNHIEATGIKLSNDEFHLPHVWAGAKRLTVDMVEEEGAAEETILASETARNDGVDVENTISNRQYGYELEDVTVNVGRVPLFWWPKGTGSSARGTGGVPIQSVRASHSTEFGAALETQWDLAWLLGIEQPSNVESTLRLDEYSERGPGAGLDVEYTTDRYFGLLKSYLLSEKGEDRLGKFPSRKDVPVDESLRGRLRWQHRQYLPDGWEGSFELGYQSDRNYLESWEEREFDTDKEQETAVYFKKTYENWSFDFLNKFHLNDYEYTLTELPSVGVHGAGQDLFETLTYYHDTKVSRYRERAGGGLVPDFGDRLTPSRLRDWVDEDDFSHVVSRHEVGLPLTVGDAKFVPTVIGTYSYNDRRDEGYNDLFYGAAGFRTSMSFWRLDNSVYSRLWDIDRIRHIVTPEINAFVMDGSRDDYESRYTIEYGLRQRWQTLRGPEGKKRRTDFLRINTSVVMVDDDQKSKLPNWYSFSTPEWQFDQGMIVNDDLANLGLARYDVTNQALSDFATFDVSWLISDTTAISSRVNYNLDRMELSQLSSALAVQRTELTRYYVSHRFLKNGDPFSRVMQTGVPVDERGNPGWEHDDYVDAHFLTGGVSYKLNSKYTLAVTQHYDLEQAASAYTRGTIIRRFPHWFGAFSVSFDETRGSTSFNVSFWPVGFDQIVLGSRRYTKLAP